MELCSYCVSSENSEICECNQHLDKHRSLEKKLKYGNEWNWENHAKLVKNTSDDFGRFYTDAPVRKNID